MLKYKGFIGHFFFDEKRAVFQGNVANSNDVITFEGASVTKIEQAFQEAVDEHIEWSKKYGKKLEESSAHNVEIVDYH